MADRTDGLELRSLITADRALKVTLEHIELEEPAAGELIVSVRAAPINPSDLGLLLGPVDVDSLAAAGTAERPVLTGRIPEHRLASVAGRLGQSLPVGNEGAGIVVRAGPDLQHLVGRTVAMIGGGMYTQYRRIGINDCIVLPEDASAEEGAALFVNPLTALGFIETMRAGGHSAIVHTAAASNLGKMLVRVCLAENIPLVNIVRSEAQAALLRELGATHVIDSTAGDFGPALDAAVAATDATLAFDAIGGGTLAGQILTAMERASVRKTASYSRYGSDTLKELCIYGSLDPSPTILDRSFGLSWRMSGWLLFPFLQKAGPETVARLKDRVGREFRTTFISDYAERLSFADALRPETVRRYQQKKTGTKALLTPSAG